MLPSPDEDAQASLWRAVAAARWLPGYRPKGRRIVRLYNRPGNDLTNRFLLIVEALARLRSRSCIIDGEGCAAMEARGARRLQRSLRRPFYS